MSCGQLGQLQPPSETRLRVLYRNLHAKLYGYRHSLTASNFLELVGFVLQSWFGVSIDDWLPKLGAHVIDSDRKRTKHLFRALANESLIEKGGESLSIDLRHFHWNTWEKSMARSDWRRKWPPTDRLDLLAVALCHDIARVLDLQWCSGNQFPALAESLFGIVHVKKVEQ